MDPHLNSKFDEKGQPKQPDAIYVDDVANSGDSQQKKEFFDSFYRMEKASYPLPWRVFTFSASCMLFLCCLLVSCLLAFSLVIGLLALYQSPALNAPVLRFWRTLRRMLVIALGFFIASFNPAFGFGIILLYFSMHGEQMNTGIMMRMMRR